MLRQLTRPLARALTRSGDPSKTVAIVIPLSSRPQLTPDEQVSLRHLEHYLGRYDRYLLAPPDSPIRLPGFHRTHFPKRFFGSVAAHNLLLYSPAFYRHFSAYRYILFYHFDSLVLSDQLEHWCAAGYDFIGPPWLHCADTPWIKRPRVGNGGFALLNVRAALEVFYRRYEQKPEAFWVDLMIQNSDRARPLFALLRWLQPHFPHSPLVNRPLKEWAEMMAPGKNNRHNDVFWADKAVRYLPSFRVAPFEEGLRFAFEASPRTCLELNGGKLPFGCHAWGRYDRKFWEPFLVAETAPSRSPQPAGSASTATAP